MTDELELDLDQIEEDAEKTLEVKNRYKQLSEKVIQEKKEKEELAAREAEKSKALEETVKERDFYKDFSTHSAKYPAAAEFHNTILEKVKSGYSTEDAILSTLAKEGKLTSTQETAEVADVAGGSAQNTVVDTADKAVSEMTTDEKLAALIEAEKKGDISV